MAALTPVDLANMALGIITEAPIDSLEEDTRAARLASLHMDTVREAELTKREWVFATMTADVAEQDTGDAYWPFSYEMPDDCLRVLPLMQHGVEIDWRISGAAVQTRYGGPRAIRYIGNIVDPNDWPAVFTDVLAAALAVKIAHPITGKTSFVQVAQNAYSNAVTDAIRVNAVQKRGRQASGSWEQARGGRSCF